MTEDTKNLEAAKKALKISFAEKIAAASGRGGTLDPDRYQIPVHRDVQNYAQQLARRDPTDLYFRFLAGFMIPREQALFSRLPVDATKNIILARNDSD